MIGFTMWPQGAGERAGSVQGAGRKPRVCLSSSVLEGAIKTAPDSRRAGRMPPAAWGITPLLPRGKGNL